MIKILLILVVLASAFNLQAQPNFSAAIISAGGKPILFGGHDPHDSILFDGANTVRTENYFSVTGDECEYRVTYVKGNATGKIKTKRIYEFCGNYDTAYEYENGALQKFSVIKGGEPVKTGPESSAKIELSDGSVIVLGPNTNYTLPENVCDLLKKSFLDIGSIWIKMKRLIGGSKFEVATERAVDGNRGTEYTVEIIEENGIKYDVTKVYEGSVEISLKNIDTKGFENKGDEITKLTEEFQSGKITIEEFEAKSSEITQSLQNETSQIGVIKIVEAGYSLKTDGKILGEPEQFDTSADNWFKISE